MQRNFLFSAFQRAARSLMSTRCVCYMFVCLFVLLKKFGFLLTHSPHNVEMNSSQKRPRCGHVVAMWDSHTEKCKSCCGCCRELPCFISKTWSPETWEKAALSRTHTSRVSRRGKSSGTGRGKPAAATSPGTPATVGGHPDNSMVARQGTSANVEVTLDKVSAEGPSQTSASTLSHPQTESTETIAATGQPGNRSTGQPGNRSTGHKGHRSSSHRAVSVTGSPVNRSSKSPVNRSTGSPVNRSTGHRSSSPVNQATGQPGNRSTGSPVNQATDHTSDRASSSRAEPPAESVSSEGAASSSSDSASCTPSHSSRPKHRRRDSTRRHSGGGE